MKNLINTIFFGRDKFSFLIALGIVCAIVLGCSCGKDFDLSNLGKESNTTRTSSNSDNPFSTGSDEIPPPSELESLVKDTTEDFAKAVDNNDFSTMRENASSDFQSQFSEQQMRDAFKTYVDNKKIVLPALNNALTATPVFSPPPSFRSEKGMNILVISGKFPSKPRELRFETEYIKRDGEWKLLKYVVNM